MNDREKACKDCLMRCLEDMDNIDQVTEMCGLHPFTLMRKDLEKTLELFEESDESAGGESDD